MSIKRSHEKRGVLFENSHKQHDSQPDMTGKITVNGVQYWLAGWRKYREGKPPFLSLSLTHPDDFPNKNEEKTEPLKEELDTDIPDDDLPF